MTARSRWGIVVGATLAVGVPLAAIVLANLVKAGILPYDAVREQFGVLSTLLWVSLGILGPVGIVVVGWSAGARGVMAWFGVIFLGLLVVITVWFLGAVELSGTMGNPF